MARTLATLAVCRQRARVPFFRLPSPTLLLAPTMQERDDNHSDSHVGDLCNPPVKAILLRLSSLEKRKSLAFNQWDFLTALTFRLSGALLDKGRLASIDWSEQ